MSARDYLLPQPVTATFPKPKHIGGRTQAHGYLRHSVLEFRAMPHTERLKVKELETENAWKDIVRIHKNYRNDHKKNHIDRGTICCLTVGTRSKWVVVHGRETADNAIRMDLNARLDLGVKSETEYDSHSKSYVG